MPTTSPEERLSAVGRTARQGAEKLSDEVQSLQSDLKTLSSKVEEGVSRAKESVSETVLEAEEAVRRNPYSAVAIGVGVGFLLGIFLRR